jgi:hypothetical protein
MMASREIELTPADLDAARTLVELADELGLPVSDLTRKVADASVREGDLEAVIHVHNESENAEVEPSE